MSGRPPAPSGDKYLNVLPRAGLKLRILLPQHPKCWNNRCTLPHQASYKASEETPGLMWHPGQTGDRSSLDHREERSEIALGFHSFLLLAG